MKTTLDATEILFEILDVPEITSIISGIVCYHDSRPLESELEDVCINAINLGDSNVQSGTLNVNIYAKDVKTKGGDKFYSVPNRERLKTISKKVVEILGGTQGKYWKDGEARIKLISEPMPVKEIGQHYLNLRISMKLHANYN